MVKLSMKRKRLIVQRTIELLTPSYAWGKGSWRKKNTRAPEGVQMCLLGGLQQAYEDVTGKKSYGDGGDIAAQLSLAALARAKNVERGLMGAAAASPSTAVFTFNDARTTKKNDVLALLREKEAELA